jgi:hypothetical protein
VGTLTVAGGTAVVGTLLVGSTTNGTGAAWVSSGQLTVTGGLDIAGPGAAVGQMTISNGAVLVGNQNGVASFEVGAGLSSVGTFTMNGGTFSSVASNDFWFVGGSSGSTGSVWGNGGTITVTNGSSSLWLGFSGAGQWSMTNGSVTVGDLYCGVEGLGTLTIAGGTFSVVSNTTVSYGGTGTVWVTGGQWLAPNGLCVLGAGNPAQMTVSGGTAVVRSMIISSNNAVNASGLNISGGHVTVFDSLVVGDCGSNAIGQITVNGGTLYVTNATHTGYIDLRDGTITLNGGGALMADILVATNTCGAFVRNGGTLSIGTTILVTNLSTVGDGIPDTWRAQYFPNVDPIGRTTNNLTCASCDPDGDGMSNLQEYLAGTDPTNSSSVLRMTAITPAGADVRVYFTSVGAKYYALQRSDSMGGTWTAIVTNIPGNDGIQWVKDIGAATRTGAFYRIGLLQLSSPPPVDSDGDGMPDLWTEEYFGHPTGQGADNSLATDDADGDGFSNLQEYLAGTDPTNSASYFHIISVVPSGIDLVVTWMMGSSRTNALQASAGDASGGYTTNNFTDIFIVTNTIGTVTNYLDTGAATNVPARYYRVRIVP